MALYLDLLRRWPPLDLGLVLRLGHMLGGKGENVAGLPSIPLAVGMELVLSRHRRI
jgi:hypothetical protein